MYDGNALATRSQLTSRIISKHVFRVVIYVCLGLCGLALLLRCIIRFTCFRRLLPEDYLMFFAIAILVSRSVVLDLALDNMYALMSVENNEAAPGADFINQLFRSTTTYGAVILMDTIGFWTIKVNFLMFFYRLAYQIRSYLIFWWIVLCLTAATGIVAVAILPYECLFTKDLSKLAGSCAQPNTISKIYTRYITAVAMDVFTDIMIISFPALILWRSKINLHHKLVLSSTFSLVLVTVGSTITRASIFGGAPFSQNVQSNSNHVMDLSWVLFWSFIEFAVSFIIACLVSFRSLWSSRAQRGKKAYPAVDNKQPSPLGSTEPSHPQTIGSLGVRKARRPDRTGWSKFYDSVFETCADLEGTVIDRETNTSSIQLNQWRSNWRADSEGRLSPNASGRLTRPHVEKDDERGHMPNNEERQDSPESSVQAEEDLETVRLVQLQRAYLRTSPQYVV